MFSCEFCEVFKNTFSYRTYLVAASIFHLPAPIKSHLNYRYGGTAPNLFLKQRLCKILEGEILIGGHTFVISTKNDQFYDHLALPLTKKNNRYLA